jgi:hypothetical protein
MYIIYNISKDYLDKTDFSEPPKYFTEGEAQEYCNFKYTELEILFDEYGEIFFTNHLYAPLPREVDYGDKREFEQTINFDFELVKGYTITVNTVCILSRVAVTIFSTLNHSVLLNLLRDSVMIVI